MYNWHRDSYYWNWVRLKHCLGWGWLFCPSFSIGIDKKWRAAPYWRFICFGRYTRFLVFIRPPIWYDCSMSTNIFRVIALKKLCMSLIQSMLCINYVIIVISTLLYTNDIYILPWQLCLMVCAIFFQCLCNLSFKTKVNSVSGHRIGSVGFLSSIPLLKKVLNEIIQFGGQNRFSKLR